MKEWFKKLCNKFLSVKVLVTISCLILAFIIVIGKSVEFNNIALVCIIEVISYSGINIAEDYIKLKGDR